MGMGGGVLYGEVKKWGKEVAWKEGMNEFFYLKKQKNIESERGVSAGSTRLGGKLTDKVKGEG